MPLVGQVVHLLHRRSHGRAQRVAPGCRGVERGNMQGGLQFRWELRLELPRAWQAAAATQQFRHLHLQLRLQIGAGNESHANSPSRSSSTSSPGGLTAVEEEASAASTPTAGVVEGGLCTYSKLKSSASMHTAKSGGWHTDTR